MSEAKDKALERVKLITNLFKEELEDGNFHGTIQWWNGEQIRAIMFPDMDPAIGRAEVGWAARVFSSTLTFDDIVCVNDTYIASHSTKSDGSNWQHGDMAYAVEHNTIDAGLIRECLTYMVVGRSSVVMISLPYERLHDGSVLYDWDHIIMADSDEDQDGELHGELVDAIRMAYESKKITEVLGENGVTSERFGVPGSLAEVSMMCAAVKMILNQTEGRYKVMMPSLTDEEKEYIQDSFSDPMYGIHALENDE